MIYFRYFVYFYIFLIKLIGRRRYLEMLFRQSLKGTVVNQGRLKIEGHFTLRLHSPYNNSLSLQALPSRWKLYKLGRDGILH